MHLLLEIINFVFYNVALVSFGEVTPVQREAVKSFGLVIYSWEEFLQLVGYFILVTDAHVIIKIRNK